MTETHSRRRFGRSLVAAAALIACDPKGRSWVTRALAQSSAPFHDLPPLDGKLLLDQATLEAFGDDWGHYMQRRPLAVLKPGSVQDVVTMVRFANRHCLKIAMRGQGHATFGNAQVSAGLVVDSTSSPLRRVRRMRTELSGEERNGAHDDPNNGRSGELPRGARPSHRGPAAEVGPGALWGAVWDAADSAGQTWSESLILRVVPRRGMPHLPHGNQRI